MEFRPVERMLLTASIALALPFAQMLHILIVALLPL